MQQKQGKRPKVRVEGYSYVVREEVLAYDESDIEDTSDPANTTSTFVEEEIDRARAENDGKEEGEHTENDNSDEDEEERWMESVE